MFEDDDLDEPMIEVETSHGAGCAGCGEVVEKALRMLREHDLHRVRAADGGRGGHWAQVRVLVVPDDLSGLVEDEAPDDRRPFWRRWRSGPPRRR